MRQDVVIRLLDRSRGGQEAKKKTKGESRNSGGQRSGTCLEPNCLESPRENKPYCTTHIDKMPYVARLMTEFATYEKERHALPGAKLSARLVREAAILVAGLEADRVTSGRLGALLGCSTFVAERVAAALKLKRERTKRGGAIWRIRAAS